MANAWLELCLNPPLYCRTAWESLVNGQRDGERLFTSLAYAAVLNEATSEHEENMSVLATSKKSKGF